MAPLETPPSVLRYEGHIVGEGRMLSLGQASLSKQGEQHREIIIPEAFGDE